MARVLGSLAKEAGLLPEHEVAVPELLRGEPGHVDAQESARRDAARVGDCDDGFGGHDAGFNMFLIVSEGCDVTH